MKIDISSLLLIWCTFNSINFNWFANPLNKSIIPSLFTCSKKSSLHICNFRSISQEMKFSKSPETFYFISSISQKQPFGKSTFLFCAVAFSTVNALERAKSMESVQIVFSWSAQLDNQIKLANIIQIYRLLFSFRLFIANSSIVEKKNAKNWKFNPRPICALKYLT